MNTMIVLAAILTMINVISLGISSGGNNNYTRLCVFPNDDYFNSTHPRDILFFEIPLNEQCPENTDPEEFLNQSGWLP